MDQDRALRHRPGTVGGAIREAALRLFFRYAITEKSLSWVYDHRLGDERVGRPLHS